jgi:hypothetical protein
MSSEGGVWESIFQGLKGHPEATLAGACLFIGGSMAVAGVNLAFAGGLPLAIYLVYYFRMTGHDRHAERMAELDVQKIEKTAGIEAQQRSRRALERRQKSDGKH